MVRTTAYNPDGTVRTVDQTRTANVTATDATIVSWAQRLHALLVHEGWPCSGGSH